MLLWTFCFLCLLLGVRELSRGFDLRDGAGYGRAELRGLHATAATLQGLAESLEAGVVPEPEAWARLAELPRPWGPLIDQSVRHLRSQGGAILPTLRRLRALAEQHLATLREARARSAQALAQALVCAALVPVFALSLYFILPGVSARATEWALAGAGAAGLAGFGALWLLRLADEARWGGLRGVARAEPLILLAAGERLLALVCGGLPPDLAWTEAWSLIQTEAPELAPAWGGTLWMDPEEGATASDVTEGAARSLREALRLAPPALRRAIQASLVEGRPCRERIEAALSGLRLELRARIEREIGLLGARSLQPLFLCVAPALLGLLLYGLWLGWESTAAWA
jgi:hypothetical protein